MDFDLITLFSPYELLLAHAALLFAACFLLLAPLFAPFSAAANKATALLGLGCSLAVYLAVPASEGAGGFFGLYVHDFYAHAGGVLILAASAFFVLLRPSHLCSGEFFALFLFMILCLLLMISSSNLILIFAALEGSSLALYALIAYRHEAHEAALGYFSYGMLGSALFAMGSAIYYFQQGTLFITALDKNGLLAAVFFIAVVGYKLSVAPFSAWLARVYEQTEGALAGFISVVPKIAMGVFALRLAAASAELAQLAAAIAGFSMLYAAVRSLLATSARELLVHSSISHSAFALAAAAAASINGAAAGGVMFYYFAVFALVNMALFALVGAARNSGYERFSGLFASQGVLAAFMVLCLLNLAALPPFGVFFAKVAVISAAFSQSVLLALAMAGASVIMLIAYLRFAAAILRPSSGRCENIYLSSATKIALVISAAASVFASYFASVLL